MGIIVRVWDDGLDLGEVALWTAHLADAAWINHLRRTAGMLKGLRLLRRMLQRSLVALVLSKPLVLLDALARFALRIHAQLLLLHIVDK